MIALTLMYMFMPISLYAVEGVYKRSVARAFYYPLPEVVSLKQQKTYGTEDVDVLLSFETKMKLESMRLILSTNQSKAAVLYHGHEYTDLLPLDLKFINGTSEVRLKFLKKQSFSLVSFKLQVVYQYPYDAVLKYIADRKQRDYTVDSARHSLIEKVKAKTVQAESIFSLHLYGRKFLLGMECLK